MKVSEDSVKVRYGGRRGLQMASKNNMSDD